MDDKAWFKQFEASPEYKLMVDRPIVYFCAEYAINEHLPIYAGGLGVLAGDYLHEAAEQNIPLIAVGLFYHEGYPVHDLFKEGLQLKSTERINPVKVGLKPVTDTENNRIIVSLPIQESQVYAQAWILQIGIVTIYLLDTNISQNEEENKRITDQLYVSSKDVRLKQEMVLSLGGMRLLKTLGISPIGYHLNEGHSALLVLEIARYEMEKHHRTFQEELDNTKRHIFFTNHTLVAAGNDTYHTDLVATLLSGFARELQVPVNEIINLGIIAESNIFSMTLLSLRMAGKINAVSKLHSEKAREIWKDYHMAAITNGINVQRWDKIKKKEKMREKHLENKRLLLNFIRKYSGEVWDESTILLGWARRIVNYKRPLALFEDPEGFRQLATSTDKPVRVVISGLSHAEDMQGQQILEQIEKIVKKDLKGFVVYIPRYNLETAKLLVSGCDVWLNTPVVGFEACGTSGMKAALNGVLPCSTADGWVAEADLSEPGWFLENENVSRDLLHLLKDQILPLYYGDAEGDKKDAWLQKMISAREMILNQFSATTMLRNYIEEFYLPLIREHLNRV